MKQILKKKQFPQILAVNGISLLNMPYNESLKILQNTGTFVELTVSQIYRRTQQASSSLMESTEGASLTRTSIGYNQSVIKTARSENHYCDNDNTKEDNFNYLKHIRYQTEDAGCTNEEKQIEIAGKSKNYKSYNNERGKEQQQNTCLINKNNNNKQINSNNNNSCNNSNNSGDNIFNQQLQLPFVLATDDIILINNNGATSSRRRRRSRSSNRADSDADADRTRNNISDCYIVNGGGLAVAKSMPDLPQVFY